MNEWKNEESHELQSLVAEHGVCDLLMELLD